MVSQDGGERLDYAEARVDAAGTRVEAGVLELAAVRTTRAAMGPFPPATHSWLEIAV